MQSRHTQGSREGCFILKPSGEGECISSSAEEERRTDEERSRALAYWQERCPCRLEGVASLRECVSQFPPDVHAHIEPLLNPCQRILGLLAPFYWGSLKLHSPARNLLQGVQYALAWRSDTPVREIRFYSPADAVRLVEDCDVWMSELVVLEFCANPKIRLAELFGPKRRPFVTLEQVRGRSLKDEGLPSYVRVQLVNEWRFILQTACSVIADDGGESGSLERLAALYTIGNIPAGLDCEGRLLVLTAQPYNVSA